MRVLIAILLLLFATVEAQTVRGYSASELFQRIEHGICAFSVDDFKNEFGPIVTLSIGSGEGGRFSANQTVSILERYFSERRYISFTFSFINEKGLAPYATGRLVSVHKGNQESVQIYVSLIKRDSRWVIDQFNIY